MSMVEKLEAMLVKGQDDALLRFSLGSAFLKQGDAEQALKHLQVAVQYDPGYSAAWKALGAAFAKAGREVEAAEAFNKGIQVAEDKGDLQAAREMKVFLKRLRA